MQIKTVKFVSWTTLTDGLNDLLMDAISSGIGDRVTWGDARHTLILASDIIEDANIEDSDSADEKEFLNRLKSLDADTFICMET